MGTPELISARSPRIAAARRLARRNFRGKERRFIAEGPQAVREAAAHRGGDGEPTLTELFATVEAADRYADIVDAARAAGARVHLADGDVLADVSQTVTPQGLIGVCRFLDSPFEEILAAKPTLVAVLAHVRDPGNAGTVLRCADAAGADAVVLTGRTVDPYNPKVVRATTGSLFHVPVAVGVDLATAVAKAHEAGVRVIAADVGGGDFLASRDVLAEPTAWLFGNEARGLEEDALALADLSLRLPIYGAAESLNLATAASVCLYETAFAQRAAR